MLALHRRRFPRLCGQANAEAFGFAYACTESGGVTDANASAVAHGNSGLFFAHADSGLFFAHANSGLFTHPESCSDIANSDPDGGAQRQPDRNGSVYFVALSFAG